MHETFIFLVSTGYGAISEIYTNIMIYIILVEIDNSAFYGKYLKNMHCSPFKTASAYVKLKTYLEGPPDSLVSPRIFENSDHIVHLPCRILRGLNNL